MQIDDLEELLEHARVSNATMGITGALIYVEGVFLQILEGDRFRLEELMDKICRDVRHETITIFREGEVPLAIFSDWKMAYVGATSEQVATWAGLRATTGMPEVLADIRQDPQRVAQVAQSILALLVSEKTPQINTD